MHDLSPLALSIDFRHGLASSNPDRFKDLHRMLDQHWSLFREHALNKFDGDGEVQELIAQTLFQMFEQYRHKSKFRRKNVYRLSLKGLSIAPIGEAGRPAAYTILAEELLLRRSITRDFATHHALLAATVAHIPGNFAELSITPALVSELCELLGYEYYAMDAFEGLLWLDRSEALPALETIAAVIGNQATIETWLLDILMQLKNAWDSDTIGEMLMCIELIPDQEVAAGRYASVQQYIETGGSFPNESSW